MEFIAEHTKNVKKEHLVAAAVLAPFVASWLSDSAADGIVRCAKIVTGVPSNIPVTLFDFARHFGILMTSLHRSKPQSLNYMHEGNRLLCGFSCRSLFETALILLRKNHTNGQPIKILTTPVHHKSFVEIMEKHTDNIEMLELDERHREIVLDQHAEELIKNCDIIVVTHLFGRTFDMTKLVELKSRYNKILIVDSVMAGARAGTHGETGVDLDIYSTGQDKRPVAIGGGYCVIRHALFNGMEAEVMSYPVVTSYQRLMKLANTLMLRQLYTDRRVLLLLYSIFGITGTKLSSVVIAIRTANPGFDHTNYLRCPSESMVRSIKSELGRVKQMEDAYIACWKAYLKDLPDDVREVFYPYYDKDEDIILPYNQIRMPNVAACDALLNFCDRHMIGCVPNNNYKCMGRSAPVYHDLMKRIMNFVTVIRPLNEISFLSKQVIDFASEC